MAAKLSKDVDLITWLKVYLPVLSSGSASKNAQVVEPPPRELGHLEALRVTGAQSLERCPRLWATQNLSLELKPRVDNKFSWFGTVAHEVCETYSAGLWELGSPHEAAIWHLLDQAQVAASEQLALLWYVTKALPSCWATIALEREFTLPLMPADAPPIRGHIDLVYDDDGTVVIRDHKTNRRAAAVKTWQADLQTLAYGLAAKTLWPGRPRRFEIGYVNLQRVIDWPITDALDDLATQRLAATWLQLKAEWGKHGPSNHGEWLAIPGNHCGFCQLATCDARPNSTTLLESLAGML